MASAETAAEKGTSLFLREPRESELALCRLLLPRASDRPFGRHFRLAFAGEDQNLIAALSYRDDSTALGGVALHVIPPYRRLGFGTQLLEYTRQEARRLGRDVVSTDIDLKVHHEAEPFLTSQGFHRAGTITFAEIGIGDLRKSMDASRERLQAANRLPESAKVVSLAEAPAQELARLYAEHISYMHFLPGFGEIVRLDEAEDSIALLIGGKVAGFILARITAGLLHIPAWVVAPEFRGQQLGFALLAQLAGRVSGRVERLQFEFTDAAGVTAGMLSVPGCQVTRVAARFERRLRREPNQPEENRAGDNV
jgi:GNAT superfamily N-acetyltransferase